jgi:ACS family tartrate transporter-like MFS transporter
VSENHCGELGSTPAGDREAKMATDETAVLSSVNVKIEAQTIRKLRRRIIPFILILFIFNVLDRNNIGFAALTMNADLGIDSHQYGLLAGMFFFGYFAFGIPSNLLLHKLGARIWISCVLIVWGLVASLTGFAQNITQLYIIRFVLGLAEAGFFPGIVLYLTYWFPERERARPVAMFMTGLPIMIMFGAPVSGWILDHVHWLGISAWRWLLIVEGIPAAIGGILTYFVLPSYPKDAKFLTSEEKDWLCAKLAHEEEEKHAKHEMSVLQTMASGRVWYLAIVYFVFLTDYYCLNFWMPLEVKSLSTHFSNTEVGLLVMIPNIMGLLAMILVSYSSDRLEERRYHAAGTALIGGIAMMLLGSTSNPILSIILLSVVTMGIYSFFGPFWSLPSAFLTGASAASGIALINSIANFGGFAGPYAIGVIAQKTGSVARGMAGMSFALFLAAVMVLLMRAKRKSE